MGFFQFPLPPPNLKFGVSQTEFEYVCLKLVRGFDYSKMPFIKHEGCLITMDNYASFVFEREFPFGVGDNMLTPSEAAVETFSCMWLVEYRQILDRRSVLSCFGVQKYQGLKFCIYTVYTNRIEFYRILK